MNRTPTTSFFENVVSSLLLTLLVAYYWSRTRFNRMNKGNRINSEKIIGDRYNWIDSFKFSEDGVNLLVNDQGGTLFYSGDQCKDVDDMFKHQIAGFPIEYNNGYLPIKTHGIECLVIFATDVVDARQYSEFFRVTKNNLLVIGAKEDFVRTLLDLFIIEENDNKGTYLLTKKKPKYDVTKLEFEKLHRESAHYHILDLAPSECEVLDVGCATGYLGHYLTIIKGCTVDGIDLDPLAAKIASTRYRKVLTGSADDELLWGKLDTKYDLILVAAILEHLPDPERVMRYINRYLRPGGYVLLNLPNIAHWSIRWELLEGRFDYSDYGILDRTHLRFFTLSSARNFVKDSGLEVIEERFATPGITELEKPLITLLPRGGYRLRNLLLRSRPNIFTFEYIMLCQKR